VAAPVPAAITSRREMMRRFSRWAVGAVILVASVVVAAAAVPVEEAADNWWWCYEAVAGFIHEDYDREYEGEWPAGPFVRAEAPDDKHSDSVVIGAPCWDDGEAESHTQPPL
jgi:hypothetical protein